MWVTLALSSISELIECNLHSKVPAISEVCAIDHPVEVAIPKDVVEFGRKDTEADDEKASAVLEFPMR